MGKAGYRGLIRTIAAVIVVLLLFSQTVFALDSTAADDNSQYLQSVIDMVKEQYGAPMTEDQLVKGALDGIFNSLDPYTTFYSKEETDSFIGGMSGSYAGIGVTIEPSGNYILVTEVFEGSPAEKAGILQGDRILTVDGKSVAGKSSDQAAAFIMGKEGSTVKLGISRGGKKGTLQFTVVRATVRISPVTYDIRNGIGYIKLDEFTDNTDEFMTKALAEMDRNKVTKLILDLRSNPGGEVSQAVAVAQKFVPRGIVTTLDYKSPSYADMEYRSYLDKTKYKLAVLVNENSASASEIVAGAIQDTAAGKLIGTKTFGKAKFQGLIPILTPAAYEKYQKLFGGNVVSAYDLTDKYGVEPYDNEIEGYTKITLGYYYTPKGRMIDGKGLQPDIAVSDPAPVSSIDVDSVQKFSKTVKPGLNGQGSDVLNAEKILKLLGYSVGTPDTLLDSKTFSAIKKFQKTYKLYSYGVLDYTTQKELYDAYLKKLPSLDKQYAKAVEALAGK